MKIALISTYPPRQCGIATYTRKLARALVEDPLNAEIIVIAEEGGASTDNGIDCMACFRRGMDFSDRVVQAAIDNKVDVAHFQYAPDIFGMGSALQRAFAKLSKAGIKVVITLHTVYTRTSGLLERKPFVARFHKKVFRAVDLAIVHNNGSRDILLDHGYGGSGIAVIPHGTDAPVEGDPGAGRRILGTGEGDAVILFFGFIHVQKNIQVVIKAMPSILEKVPSAKLVIAGKEGGDAWYNRIYLNYLRRLVRRLGIEDRVSMVSTFIPDENVPDIHAAAKLVVMPHSQGYGSASGVVHNAMTMGLPMVCSDSIKFEEVADRISPDLSVGTHDKRAWIRMIVKLLEDQDYYEEVKSKVAAYAGETEWHQVGKLHMERYSRLSSAGD
jgi:glycosyltransferase involved in cell wall biosynthesis